MKSFFSVLIIYFLLLIASAALAQKQSSSKVVITGARFAYPLVEKWIQDYKAVHPNVEVLIESRTTIDPANYDLLIEAYEQDKSITESRDYLYFARYALLPVANSKSAFAKIYSEKGLTTELIKQIYFSDIYSDKEKEKQIDANYTVYTRLQKAGAPITFSAYFGYQQTNIKGKAIAGADEHLIKALLKDTIGVSYTVPALLYNLQTRKPLDGLAILPVDLDKNDRITSDEIFYDNLDHVIEKLETGNLRNIPVEYLHLSIGKKNTNVEALKFLEWVAQHSQDNLYQFGFLKPEPKRFQQGKAKFGVALN